ncbi:Cinnamoyl-CoA reductase-like SNL6 [Camellia lanceoleosa]|uniref:Cinnamoyl-CoA reductase-like SNL6 n=1 Tax=Camellia lanceoleosa TaxID=1840588 RepID=A0ACC0J3N6_9ERIC|nr:Cinnamoyl-CoA reductase-like SNL6 [Camellia lanceoleosa]
MVMDGYRDEVVVSKPPAATALSNDEERCVDNRSNGFSCSFSAIKERGLLCVTSGNTCLGSHLVKKLLSRGYFIRVTIQNQEDFEDMKELIKQEEMNLLESVVVAKMGDLDSLCEAFRGCHAIFHTSSFTDPHGVAGYTERTAFLETEAAKNVIEACARAAYVKRCIFTSSLLASIWNINNADRIVDESCWSNEAFCRENKLWLALGKTTAEKAAWRKSRELKVKLITICPALLMAPSFPNAHIETSLPYLKGGQVMLQRGILATQDVGKAAEVHIHAYEAMDYGAGGRYLCFDRVVQRLDEAIQLENWLKMKGLLSGGGNVMSVEEDDETPSRISNSRVAKLVFCASQRLSCKQ